MMRLLTILKRLFVDKSGHFPLALFLIISEIPLCLFIIFNVKYTEIDWIAYMEEVDYFLNGTLDYDKIQGQTGPCVYPAGFLYIFSILRYFTEGGSQLLLAQFIFLALYLLTLGLVFNIYRLAKQIPPYVFIFMCVISYRVHSIYLLRLFNDPIAMFFVFACVNALLYGRFSCACILFSLGLSVKMNVLLFAPGLLLVLLWYRGILETAGHMCECLIVQLILGTPFLFHNPLAYVSCAFNFGRQFMYKWTVNWRVVPEALFLDRRFHYLLLGFHVAFLVILLWRFIRSHGGFQKFLELHLPNRSPIEDPLTVIYPLFVSNFIGIAFSRSLHYQFYVWYFHTLAFLFWSVDRFPSSLRLLLMGLIEICWNTYPSTRVSSGLLHACHFILLMGLVSSPVFHRAVHATTVTSKPHPGKRQHQKLKQM